MISIGLGTFKFPAVVNVSGSPVVLTANQVGINVHQDFPSVNLGVFLKRQGAFTKSFKVSNTGPKDIELEWKVFLINQQKGQKSFDVKFTENLDPSKSDLVCLKFEPIEPPEVEQPYFSIQPKLCTTLGRRR